MKHSTTLSLAALAAAFFMFCPLAIADCGTCCDISCAACPATCCDTCCETCCNGCCPSGCCNGCGHMARRTARQAAYQDCVASHYGTYAHVGWGAPVTLVVPPTARYQTDYGWGVGNTRVSPIYPQFSRQGYGAATYYGSSGQYRTTPLWPSDTTQFGIYYARGPW